MNARQDTAWKNLSFYRGYLPPADREKVKEYLLLSIGEEVSNSTAKREGSVESSVTSAPAVNVLNLPPTPTLTSSLVADLLTPIATHDAGSTAPLLGTFKVEAFDSFPAPPPAPLNCTSGCCLTPQSSNTMMLSPMAPGAPSPAAPPARRLEYKRFFMIKKSDLAQVPHFKSFLFKVKKCLEICTNPQPCTSPECHNVHVEVEGNDNLIELQFEQSTTPTQPDTPTLIVNRGNQLPSLSVRACDMERTAGALFCFGLMKHQITQAVQGTQCRFGDKCRYGSRCLFIHLKGTAVDEAPVDNIVNITEAETLIGDALPILKDYGAFVERLKELGMETVGDVQILSNTAFDSIVSRSASDDHGLWPLVHTLREVKERDVPLPLALATFPGVPGDRVSASLEMYRLESINQLLAMKPKAFYALRLPPKVMDACERIRLRYEPEREAYSTIDLTRLASSSFIRRMTQQVLSFRLNKAHKSWRKQDATRPIVTSLITYVEASECCCHIQGTFSATQTPALGFSATSRSSTTHRDPMLQSPQKGIVPPTPSMSGDSADHPDNSWCRCPRKYEIAVNYELSTPSGSRCSEQNCLGKLASMGLATCAIREIFVHGDMHNNEDPNPLFPCGVCENMLRRITHDVQKQFGGDVTLYMFDQVATPKKLVCIPVQEISHREGSSFKRFIQEDLRGDMDDKFNSSLTQTYISGRLRKCGKETWDREC